MAAAVVVLYLVLVLNEDVVSDDRWQIAFIATALLATALLGVAGAVVPRAAARAVLLSAAATAMTVWGLIGIFSIGLPLLTGAGLTWVAVARNGRHTQGAVPAAAASLLVLATTFFGFALTT